MYSISGKDKRFPALFKTVLKNGYALPHPNCRHEFIPWYEEMEAPEDVEKAIRKSKIKYDSKGELVDVRYQKDIKAYQEWQAANAHGDIYEKVKDDIANIIQDPDFIFISDKRENSVIFVSILHKAQFIVKLNVESKQKANTIITIFGCGEKTLKRLKKKNEILYKKGVDKIEK